MNPFLDVLGTSRLPLPGWRLALSAALLLAFDSGVFAHGTGPGPGGHGTAFVDIARNARYTTNKKSYRGSNGITARMVAIDQAFSEEGRRKYLVFEAKVPRAAAGNAAPLLKLSRADGAEPYAECKLGSRVSKAAWSIFALGIKDVGDGTLIRWGDCDDLTVPGFDSAFPNIQAGDKAVLQSAQGTVLLAFDPVAIPAGRPVTKPIRTGQPAPHDTRRIDLGKYKLR